MPLYNVLKASPKKKNYISRVYNNFILSFNINYKKCYVIMDSYIKIDYVDNSLDFY